MPEIPANIFLFPNVCSCVVGTTLLGVPIWWSSACLPTMFPCHVSPWPSAEPQASCGSHAPQTQPSQPLPDLLCSCPAPPLNSDSQTPSPDPMESLIVITEYEPSRPTGEEEVRGDTPCYTSSAEMIVRSCRPNTEALYILMLQFVN